MQMNGGVRMIFKRKAYLKIKEWKDKYAPNYAYLLEGTRRVRKTTLAINFAENEYKSYILIDVSNVKKIFWIYLMILAI